FGGGSTSTYSLKQPEAKKLMKILKVPGEHNIYNALAALTCARALKIPDKISFKALSEYKGAWRRFEIVQTKPFILISDYGHNPTKAMAGMKAAREKYPNKKIWCVYQPHQYQRTYYLFKDFVRVFRKALRQAQGKRPIVDKLIITDIYDVAGREEKEIKNKISSEKLVKAIKKENVIYIPKDGILDYLKNNLEKGQVLIIMGAGDIYNLTKADFKIKN
ncbi:MAG: cyanophycin synthetase, partial [Patescibacteria group bacterium]